MSFKKHCKQLSSKSNGVWLLLRMSLCLYELKKMIESRIFLVSSSAKMMPIISRLTALSHRPLLFNLPLTQQSQPTD